MITVLTAAEERLLALVQAHGSLGNGRAQELLGLGPEAYAAAKEGLYAQGLVAYGRGRGGSIKVAEGQGLQVAHRVSGAPVASTHVAAAASAKADRVDREGAKGREAERHIGTGPEASEPIGQEASSPKAL